MVSNIPTEKEFNFLQLAGCQVDRKIVLKYIVSFR
jgi:hypothetical protein